MMNRDIVGVLYNIVYQQTAHHFPVKPFMWEEGIAHFLTDLRHLAELCKVDWQKALLDAECFYAEEKENG